MANKPDIKPIESAHYFHFLMGGPEDGSIYPSKHLFCHLRFNGVKYERVSEPVRLDEMPSGWQVLNCTDEYDEPIAFRVDMRSQP